MGRPRSKRHFEAERSYYHASAGLRLQAGRWPPRIGGYGHPAFEYRPRTRAGCQGQLSAQQTSVSRESNVGFGSGGIAGRLRPGADGSGRFDESEGTYERRLRCSSATHGQSLGTYGDRLSNLAGICLKSNRIPKAVAFANGRAKYSTRFLILLWLCRLGPSSGREPRLSEPLFESAIQLGDTA